MQLLEHETSVRCEAERQPWKKYQRRSEFSTAQSGRREKMRMRCIFIGSVHLYRLGALSDFKSLYRIERPGRPAGYASIIGAEKGCVDRPCGRCRW